MISSKEAKRNEVEEAVIIAVEEGGITASNEVDRDIVEGVKQTNE